MSSSTIDIFTKFGTYFGTYIWCKFGSYFRKKNVNLVAILVKNVNLVPILVKNVNLVAILVKSVNLVKNVNGR